MRCINCGNEINEKDAVCPNCHYIQYEEGPKLDDKGHVVNVNNHKKQKIIILT